MKLSKRKAVALAAFVAGSVAAQEKTDRGQEMFQLYCAPCHQMDSVQVGPSLIEIATIHRGDAEGIVKWAMEPEKKRPEMVEMPPMAALGEPTLRDIAEYILKITEGKTMADVQAAEAETVPSLADIARPYVQRIFMPDAGPAAIAVALPGRFSYCWDAGNCRLRYVWSGRFIDPMPVWSGNGNGLAKILGDVVLTAVNDDGVRSDAAPEFHGYRLVNGVPEFRYAVGALDVRERFEALPENAGVVQVFEIVGATAPVRIGLPSGKGVKLDVVGGTVRDGVLELKPHEARSFSVAMRFTADGEDFE